MNSRMSWLLRRTCTPASAACFNGLPPAYPHDPGWSEALERAGSGWGAGRPGGHAALGCGSLVVGINTAKGLQAAVGFHYQVNPRRSCLFDRREPKRAEFPPLVWSSRRTPGGPDDHLRTPGTLDGTAGPSKIARLLDLDLREGRRSSGRKARHRSRFISRAMDPWTFPSAG
jgi:hypothetical protein